MRSALQLSPRSGRARLPCGACDAHVGPPKGRIVGGGGKEAEVDGGYFGGNVKPANVKAHRRDRRFAGNQSGKRKVVVIVRERDGNSVPVVFNSESQAASFIRARSRSERLCMPMKPQPGIT